MRAIIIVVVIGLLTLAAADVSSRSQSQFCFRNGFFD